MNFRSIFGVIDASDRGNYPPIEFIPFVTSNHHAATRQATPGPSTILQPHTTQSVNFRKRAATERDLEEVEECRGCFVFRVLSFAYIIDIMVVHNPRYV